MTTHRSDLDIVFGADVAGDTASERARHSTRWFARSQAQLAPYRTGMTGLQITAQAALELVGFEKLVEAVDKGAVVVNPTLDEPARTIREQREALEVTIADVSGALEISEKVVAEAEVRGTVTQIRTLLRIAQVLGLNDDLLSARPQADADRELALRLRTLRHDRNAKLSASLVLKLSEAAWVISKQYRTLQLLGEEGKPTAAFRPDGDYGPPAWRQGFELADQTRKLLDIDPIGPIPSVRKIIERLGIPLVQVELGHTFAGATLQNGSDRGIVVNVEGDNTNVWVRRTTLGHELGHLLWDPAQKLQRLHVDRYRDLNVRSMEPVEARANAFAIALLAPRAAVVAILQKPSRVSEKVAELMSTFGIAATAAKFHLANVANDWGQPLDTTRVRRDLLPVPSNQWTADENWTVDYFPIPVPLSRRGRFAGLVALAAKQGLISLDQAAASLMVTTTQLDGHLDELIDVCVHDLAA